MLTNIIRKNYNHESAIYSFFMIAFSWVWLENNLEVRHSAVVNMALVFSVYIASCFKGRSILRTLIIGIAIGIAINARVVLAPLGFILLIALCLIRKRIHINIPARKFCLLIILGGLIPSIPTILLFINDPNLFLFDYIIHRTLYDETNISGNNGIYALKGFFFSNETITNSIFLIPLSIGIVSYLLNYKRIRINKIFDDPLLIISLSMIIGVYISYSFADRFSSSYLHHIIPFLIIFGIGLYSQLNKYDLPNYKQISSKKKFYFMNYDR